MLQQALATPCNSPLGSCSDLVCVDLKSTGLRILLSLLCM